MSLNHLKFIFLLGLIYMSFVGWSSNSWLLIWFIMEIGFLFFVGFVFTEVNYGIVELMMKYFISQVFISLMFSSLMVLCLFNLSCHLYLSLIVILCMKLGMFPFHFWVIMVLGKLNWFSFLLMMTFIKLLPALFLYYLNNLTSLNFILFMSSVASGVLGLGNVVIQKLLAYSSLAHLCWLVLSLSISIEIFLIYFLCYFIMMLIFAYVFNLMNVYYVNQFKLICGNYTVKFLIFFLVLSFAGFPPFMGFMVKWIIVCLMFFYNMKFLVFFMVFFTLFSVLFYLELFFYFMMMSSLSMGWYFYIFRSLLKVFFLVLVFYLGVYFFI